MQKDHIAIERCSPKLAALPGLFDPHIPNNPALWAVFLGRHSGQVLVNSQRRPSQCVVHTDALLTYASRDIHQEFLEAAITKLRRTERIWLVRGAGDATSPTGFKKIPRLEFYGNDPQTLKKQRERLPKGYEIRVIDEDLLQRCAWRDDMAFYCGSLRNFLHHNLGLCLMHGDEIITEAYASALGAPYAEIGAITHEPYRGQGFAPMTAAFLIDALEQRGFQAYWSCDVDNPASARVARKLRFKVVRAYEILEYNNES